ncbi:hypothetical protein O181_011832 [Austropuccinia psidii MF-1]|uniref:Endonuclease/exonuclease/phosphatase domain-containing protein n=1 Tax=Austropuccinia psidii MF-1 TaxID=1389203 RepID=A0A9Q3BVA4_9BASI|nr:hypothetical protein [Austropuccinia psidii MF-1]
MMDYNLHHPLWNLTKYYHTHTQAQNLIKAFGKKGFHLISPKHTPTLLGPVGKPTTIDLTWASHTTLNLQPVTQVQLNNPSSDHHPILTRITPPNSVPHIPEIHILMHLKNLDPTLQLSLPLTETPTLETPMESIENFTQKITTSLTAAYTNQGKWVTTSLTRSKPWCNKEQLDKLVKSRN